MEPYITREEHNEFVRRMEDEHTRINHRLSETEENLRQIGELTISVEKMAHSVETMAKEISSHGKKLEALEQEPANKVREAQRALLNAFYGAIGTAIAGGLFYLLTMSVK